MASNDFSMLGLLRIEVEEQGKQLFNALQQLSKCPQNTVFLEDAYRATHSLKGAAKLVDITAIYTLADKLDTLFQSMINDKSNLAEEHYTLLFSTVQKIREIAALEDEEMSAYDCENEKYLSLLSKLDAIELPPSTENLAIENTIDSAESACKAQIDTSMLEMFREEIRSHGSTISDCLLALENDPANDALLEKLMRAAHSEKGAARLVGVGVIVSIAHVMEDVFVAAQSKQLQLCGEAIDLLLEANDQIFEIASLDESRMALWGVENSARLNQHIEGLNSILKGEIIRQVVTSHLTEETDIGLAPELKEHGPLIEAKQIPDAESHREQSEKHVLKVTADRWDSMMGLAGEIKVEAGWLVPYLNNMMVMRKKQHEMSSLVGHIRDYVASEVGNTELLECVSVVHNKLDEFRNIIVNQMSDLDQYERRITNLTERLHREALCTRMRPFSDGVHGFQRMVRDISRTLNKKVKLELKGETTQVDREVLEKMEAPLNHIIRNALDHGIESPEQRLQSGKLEQATIKLSACHNEGMLLITVEDDGCGINTDLLRRKVIEKELVTEQMAERLSDEELLEFLFLPSFSTRDKVTDLSGRGVGLDVVMDAIQSMHGRVKVETEMGVGSKFLMRLPLTLSVVHGLLVRVSDEHYAFPLSRIACTAKVHIDEIEVVEGCQYATINEQNIGLLAASRVFELDAKAVFRDEELSVIVVTDHENTYGVVVDEFVDQRELAVQSIDPRLGKIQDIGSCALLEDGSTALIVDVDDMVCSIDLMVKGGRINTLSVTDIEHEELHIKTVLVVDDSLTVREVERKLLEEAGYKVDIAVDGMDGWNAVRAKNYDLIICDIDMPRMNGIEMVGMIKSNKQYSDTPVIIVSYKDRGEDRQRGMDVGADYYLTKGSFHDDSFIHAVHDLIGEASV